MNAGNCVLELFDIEKPPRAQSNYTCSSADLAGNVLDVQNANFTAFRALTRIIYVENRVTLYVVMMNYARRRSGR